VPTSCHTSHPVAACRKEHERNALCSIDVREDDAKDASTAADDLVSQLGSATPKLVTLFASRDRDHRALNHAVLERLPKGTRLIGASTGGEIDRGGMSEGEVVLGALSGDFASVSASAPALARRTRRRLGAVSRACYELGVRRRTSTEGNTSAS